MGRTSEDNPCNKCAYLIWSYAEQKMVCMLNKNYGDKCYTSEYEEYLQNSKSIPVNKQVTLFVKGIKKKAQIIEVRYIEKDVNFPPVVKEEMKERYVKQHNKRDVKYCIKINNEPILYSFVVGASSGKLYLQGYIDNDVYGDEILIDITNYEYLLNLLWEIAEYTDYGMLACYARKAI